jgi:hypothetical protein
VALTEMKKQTTTESIASAKTTTSLKPTEPIAKKNTAPIYVAPPPKKIISEPKQIARPINVDPSPIISTEASSVITQTATVSAPPRAEQHVTTIVTKSSDTASLWKELHLRALTYDNAGHSDASWILAWSRKIPRFTKGCACNEHWQKWYGQNLPDYTSQESYFAWTVRAHNAVNERINKPTFTIDQAREYYTPPPLAPLAP